jgi:DnaJ family protein C protein 19
MLLLAVALAGLGLWMWFRLRKSGRKIPGAWLGIAGTLIGTVMMAKGMPVIGALVATGSGLWLRFGGSAPEADPLARTPTRAEISRAEAAELLGVTPDATREEILAAHRKLITRNHPDAGGSAGLAARINSARDVLLK